MYRYLEQDLVVFFCESRALTHYKDTQVTRNSKIRLDREKIWGYINITDKDGVGKNCTGFATEILSE